MTKKILLADDSITIRKVVGIIFATEDYQVLMADNGDDALSMAQAEVPDLVIADISMPGKDGFELCRAIKSSSQFAGKTAVMLLPGAFDHFDEDKAGEVCADGWLTKPFESQALLDKVAQLLESTPLTMPGVDGASAGAEESAFSGAEDVDFAVADFAEDKGAVAGPGDETAADDIWESVSFDDDLGEDLAAETESTESFAADVFAADAESDELVTDFSVGEGSDKDALADESDIVFAEESFENADAGDFVVSSSAEGDVSLTTPAESFDAGAAESFGEVEFSPAADAAGDDSIDFSAYEDDGTEASDFVVTSVEDEVLEEQSLDLLQEDTEEEALFLDDEVVEDSPLELESAAIEEVPFDLTGQDGDDEPLDLIGEEAQETSSEVETADFAPLEEVGSPSAAMELEPQSADADDILDLSEEEIFEEVDASDAEVFEPVETQTADIVELEVEEVASVPDFDSQVEEDEVAGDVIDEPVAAGLAIDADESVEELEVVEDSELISADLAADALEEVPAGEDDDAGTASAAVALGGAAAAAAAGVAVGVATAPASEQIEQQLGALSEDDLKAIVAKVAGPLIEKMAAEMVEKVVWEVVPDLAEVKIREEIRKITDASE